MCTNDNERELPPFPQATVKIKERTSLRNQTAEEMSIIAKKSSEVPQFDILECDAFESFVE
jgi:hypothetical protein